LGSLQYQNGEGARASDNSSLHGGGRVDVRIDRADCESLITESGDFLLETVGERLADVGVDGDLRAISVNAIFDGSLGRLSKREGP